MIEEIIKMIKDKWQEASCEQVKRIRKETYKRDTIVNIEQQTKSYRIVKFSEELCRELKIDQDEMKKNVLSIAWLILSHYKIPYVMDDAE